MDSGEGLNGGVPRDEFSRDLGGAMEWIGFDDWILGIVVLLLGWLVLSWFLPLVFLFAPVP